MLTKPLRSPEEWRGATFMGRHILEVDPQDRAVVMEMFGAHDVSDPRFFDVIAKYSKPEAAKAPPGG